MNAFRRRGEMEGLPLRVSPAWVIGGVLCLALIAVAWWRYGNAGAKIRAMVQGAAEGIERKDFWAVMRCVSPNYRDGSGLTFRDIQQMVLSWCRNKDAHVWLTVQPQRVQLQNFWQATATVQVQGIISAEGFSLPLGPMTVTLQLERTWLGQWRVTRADGWQSDPSLQKLQGEYLGTE
jgi:hypothetical protein